MVPDGTGIEIDWGLAEKSLIIWPQITEHRMYIQDNNLIIDKKIKGREVEFIALTLWDRQL